MARYLYSELARTLQAIQVLNLRANTDEAIARHYATIKALTQQHLPSGSGFDNGSKFDLDASHAGKLVFHTEFHHMNDGGFYDGWTSHTVTVTPSFTGINMRISGRNRNDIKEAIYEAFDSALKTDVTYDVYLRHYPQLAITSRWEDESGNPSECTQSWFVGELMPCFKATRYMRYELAREAAASLMVEASRKR